MRLPRSISAARRQGCSETARRPVQASTTIHVFVGSCDDSIAHLAARSGV
jgi:hypothetical protein